MSTFPMKKYFLFVYLVAVEVSASEFTVFKHASGVFEILVPSTWEITYPLGGTNIVSFKPSTGFTDLTISITPNLNLPPQLPEIAVTSMFPNETPISQITRRQGDSWNSIRQDWQGINNGIQTVWLAEFFGYKTTAVAVTLSDKEGQIQNQRQLFNIIVQSIKFQK